MMLGTRKRIPKSIAIFGAAGHIGKPAARHLRYASPDTELRLITSSAEKAAQLATEFPDAQCFHADLFDQVSLEVALAGVEGIFVVTPSPFDEATAMTNLVKAIRNVADLVHMVRITGLEPETLLRRVPKPLREGRGTAQQHYVAKDILEESDLPVTYLNIGASFMDNFLLLAPFIKAQGRMVWPSRLIGYIDTRDIGEVAANLLLSPDERNLYQLHTINNGQDLLETHEVAAMLSDILKTPIVHTPDRDAFIATYGPMLEKRTGQSGVVEGILDFIEYEKSKSSFLMLNDLTERFLGRRSTSLRAWFMEHRSHFL